MIDFIVEKIDDIGQGVDEIEFEERLQEFEFTNKGLLGASYSQLNKAHPNRLLSNYEINHMPPIASYGMQYYKISTSAMPAILMIKTDHRGHLTTGQGNLIGHDFPNRAAVRGYMREEMMMLDFCAALKADIDFLFKKPEFVFKYSKGCIQMVRYCNTLIKGAPCNVDCPKYRS